jgi:Ca2+-binding RTX toxin-like protein
MRTKLGIAATIATLTVAVGIASARGPLFCPMGGGPCNGSDSPETIVGSIESDQINALGGGDQIFANEGADVIRAGAGNDRTEGGAGRDRHIGGGSQGGADTMKGGKGNDFAEGNQEGDTILGGKGNDREIVETIRASQRRGGPSACFQGFCSNLYGDTGNDTIKGGKGQDILEGEQGRDKHFGGKGDDVIDAANDDTPGVRDIVKCGPGRDVVFANPPDEVANDCEVEKPPRPVKPPMLP